VALVALLFTSCGKEDFKSFVGTWGVEKLEYYNIDYAGNPIAASLESYSYDPEDANNSIQLVFREDKTGEMRDGAIDTLWLDYNEETETYETVIYNPDTILVYTFTYSYDKTESALYMNMKYTYPYVYSRTFMVKVSDLSDNAFTYENEYDVDYMEKAYLKRISNTPLRGTGRQTTKHPRKPGSLMGDR
jgi:hypothetical protein